MLGDNFSNDLRPDSQAFDEVRIVTTPRYKTSGLSGNEWRISATVQILRKGKIVHEQGYGNVEYAARFLPALLVELHDNGKAYFAGENDSCDQEGCSKEATVFYRKKKDWCSGCGESKEITFGKKYRKFCEEHKLRGDCGLDDADENYILISKQDVAKK